jgi:hypothetical protein
LVHTPAMNEKCRKIAAFLSVAGVRFERTTSGL